MGIKGGKFMALKLKSITLNCGIEITEPYFHLRIVSYDDINKRIGYNGAFYVGQEAYDSGKVQSIDGVYLDDWFESGRKSANLFKEAYTHIKEKAETYRGMTMEEIEAHNAQMLDEGSEGEMINPLYFYFIDAEDC